MGDLTRLFSFAARYRGRLALGVLSAILASLLLGGFVSLVKPITEQVLKQSAAPAAGAAAALPEPPAPASREAEQEEDLPLPDWVARARQRVEELVQPVREYLAGRPFVRLPLLIVLIFVVKGYFSYLAAVCLKRVGLSVIVDLRGELFGRILRQSDRFFHEHDTGLLMSRVMGDVGRVQRLLSTDFGHALRVIFTVLFMIGLALYHSWEISLLCLAGMPLVAVPVLRLGRRVKRMSTRSQERSAEISGLLNETIRGHRIIQGFGMENFEVSRLVAALRRLFVVDLKTARAVALTPAVMELIGALFSAAVLAFAGWRIAGGSLSPGDLMVVLVALSLIFTGVKRLSQMNNDLQQALAAARRVFGMMDRETEVREREDARELPRFERELHFEEVSFAYEERPVLRGLDLRVGAGEIHALVGSSGAGKTTLVSLIPRFYDPTEGRVRADGVDLREVSLRSLRDQVALVTQETILFNSSVRDNIAYGRKDVGLDRVEAAARDANAHDFIVELPQGYDTRVGESGARLSAGQRQRLTIARALLKDAPVLILDEATSALDTESEAKVQAALDRLMEGRTCVVIAHRLSTVRRATCIHVLEEGRVMESGTHEELLAAGGTYARLHSLQFVQDEAETATPETGRPSADG